MLAVDVHIFHDQLVYESALKERWALFIVRTNIYGMTCMP